MSGNCKFYESENVSKTPKDYTEVNIFDSILMEATVEEYNLSDTSISGTDEITDAVDTVNGEWESTVPPCLVQEEEPAMRRSGRIRQPSSRWTYEYVVTDDEDADVVNMFVVHEQSSYSDATKDVDYSNWQAAMREEIEALKMNDTRILVHPSTIGQKLIEFLWVFKVKPETRATNE